jgi:CRISPR-associated protein Cas1
MALHALGYCERLFYLEEVEELRVADERVYAGRALHEELAAAEGEERQTFEVQDDALGLTGKLDAVRHREGGWVPVEHKRGRAHRLPDNSPAAWPSDELQVCAYGMLLETATGQPVAEGRVRYHAENVTVRVPLDEPHRQMVRQAIARARELRASLQRPPVTDSERRCLHCSLAPICLPEEERLAEDAEWEPVRLFPPHPEGRTVHVTSHSARVSRRAETLLMESEQGKQSFPLREVEALVLHGNAQITTQALHRCASEGIAVHWFTTGGQHAGSLAPGAGPVQRRIRQYQALSQPAVCLALARRLALARMEGQLRYLLRATRGEGSRPPEVEKARSIMHDALRQAARADNLDSLRGHEGAAGRAWFSALPCLLAKTVPDELRPRGRSRRPPQDRFNALLSFGYALLYRSVLQAIHCVGLEPAFGFYHQPRSAAHPLALDIMELFRVPLWDIALVGSVNRGQWDLAADFSVTKTKVWLSDPGRRKAIELYERRLQETWKHPVLGYSLSYARTIELEVRLLEKEWSGQPGLFARARLR